MLATNRFVATIFINASANAMPTVAGKTCKCPADLEDFGFPIVSACVAPDASVAATPYLLRQYRKLRSKTSGNKSEAKKTKRDETGKKIYQLAAMWAYACGIGKKYIHT